MTKLKTGLLMLALICHASMQAQRLFFPAKWLSDSAGCSMHMPVLAKELLKQKELSLTTPDRLRLQLLAGKHTEALKTLYAFRQSGQARGMGQMLLLHYELYAEAQVRSQKSRIPFSKNFTQLMAARFARMSDLEMAYREGDFSPDLPPLRTAWKETIAQQATDSLTPQEALALCRTYTILMVNGAIFPLAKPILDAGNRKRFIIHDSLLISTSKGHHLTAMVVLPKRIPMPQPAALMFTIYAEPRMKNMAKTAAARGYAGIVVFSRGKALNTDTVMPYEHEQEDAYEVIDWISRQRWCDGRVGMYGGSYNGMAQWAATKHLHPALKTIVPYVPSVPGMGLPMESNIALTANYGWAFYVSNTRYLDDATYNDSRRWQQLPWRWFRSGLPFSKLDSIDGTPNPYFHRWLQHPSYDSYWQQMVPYKTDFAEITIPVLSVTGYYDDNSRCTLYYLREHYRYNPRAAHYLVIGPFDHFGAQWIPPATLRGYAIDPVARINTPDLTFQWFDHIFKSAPLPALLKNKINYQVMGSNTWQHAPSLEAMHTGWLRLYLQPGKKEMHYGLDAQNTDTTWTLSQRVNLADRDTLYNASYYPDPIVSTESPAGNSLAFVSEPFAETTTISGSFEALLKTTINKKDFDFGITLYELAADGTYFHLAYHLGRASYAEDLTNRRLLRPGAMERIEVKETRVVARQLQKGSRLLVLLSVNKNPWAAINYGTGRTVSEESAADAGEPLQVQWHGGSYLQIPVAR